MACPYNRRDSNLPLTEMRRKVNPAALEDGISKYLELLKGDPNIAAQYMESGSLTQLAYYADRNTSVVGYLLDKVLSAELMGLATHQEGNTVFPKDCTLYVTINVDNVTSTKQTFSSNMHLYEQDEGTGKTKRTGTEWTGYGASLDVVIAMEFRPRNMTANDPRVRKLVFEQNVVIAPDRDRRHAYWPSSFSPPAAQEFKIGAVVNLLHDNKHLTNDELRALVMPTSTSDHFPRHNDSVKEIEAALAALGSFVDMVARFLATLPPFRAASSRHSEVAMPWGPARHEFKKDAAAEVRDGDDDVKKELSDGDAAMDDADASVINSVPLVGAMLGNALDQFHRDQCNALIGGMGVLGGLVQRLSLLKAYAVHFGRCYASIDHFMVRSFMKGIGVHNAVLFENGVNTTSLDPLLNKLALHTASRAGVEVANTEIEITGCSVAVEIALPGRCCFEPLKGIPALDPDFKGLLSFGGLGSKGIPVAGAYTRQVFVLPTESDDGAKPKMRVVAKTEYANTPVIVILGTPDGKCTNAQVAFLLVDTWCMRMAIEVGAIPSNKAFAKAMSILPPEMASFAAAIRACDIAEGGLDIHVIHLAPLLASALGIVEDDLMGDPDWLTQLVGLMRGGVSLQSLAQSKHAPSTDKDGWQDVPSPKYDLAKMKQETTKLEKKMLQQGAIDHYYVPPPKSKPVLRSTAGWSDDDDGGTTFRSLSGVASAAVDALADGAALADGVDGAAPTPSAAAEGGDGDKSVEALTSDLQDLTNDDRDFMGTMLKHAEKTITNSEAVLGAILTIPDCATGCYFAKGKVPDGKTTSDFMGPKEDDNWEVRPNLNAASKTIERMLRAYAALGKPVPTTRLVSFGAFFEWETNLLTGLMSGSIDPTKNLLEAYKAFAVLQK